jgi:hypothetical protein
MRQHLEKFEICPVLQGRDISMEAYLSLIEKDGRGESNILHIPFMSQSWITELERKVCVRCYHIDNSPLNDAG